MTARHFITLDKILFILFIVFNLKAVQMLSPGLV